MVLPDSHVVPLDFFTHVFVESHDVPPHLHSKDDSSHVSCPAQDALVPHMQLVPSHVSCEGHDGFVPHLHMPSSHFSLDPQVELQGMDAIFENKKYCCKIYDSYP